MQQAQMLVPWIQQAHMPGGNWDGQTAGEQTTSGQSTGGQNTAGQSTAGQNTGE